MDGNSSGWSALRFAAVIAVLATSGAAQNVVLRELATGLEMPVAVTHAADSRLFITLQCGLIVIYDGTGILPTPFLDIRSTVLCSGERGLLSVAFHPSYAQNGSFFVDYTDGDGNLNIARYSVSADPNVADPESGTVLLTIPHPNFSNHNGGQLAFGPDGFLYAGAGDGGSGGDPPNNAQNLQVLLGKILRIDVDDVDHGAPYSIPPLNPFVGNASARPEIWAYGLRNPWRFSFDRFTGDLLIGDVGQGSWEEIDFQPAASTGGENYGWRIMEGLHCYNAVSCNQTGLVLPVLEYGHTGGACSVTGGYRYRGARSSGLYGTYLYGDYCNGMIWGAARMPNGSWSSALLYDATFPISAFGEDLAGEMYVLDYSGRLLAIDDLLSPAIDGISPDSGRSNGGDSVTITGTNLANPSSVTFGGASGTITSSSGGSINVTTPAAPSLGAVDVVVTTSGGVATSVGGFRYDLGSPLEVHAAATSATSVGVSWSAVPGATGYEVVRSADGSTFSPVGSASGTSLSDSGAAAGTAYLYEVRATNGGSPGAFSAPDLATTVVFSDDPLQPGTTLVKSEHLLQLRAAVNAVRALAGLGPFHFTDSAPFLIRAIHVTELRGALDAARSQLSLAALAYTDPSVSAGSTIVKAVHFTELRAGVR